MKVGITATRKGLTNGQREWLQRVLLRIANEAQRSLEFERPEFHHGDCIGGDEQAHHIAAALGFRMIGHPPDNPSQRAFCEFDETREPKPYLERNKDIVNETDLLIGLPETAQEVQRSGTWSTIRHARRCEKQHLVIPGRPK